MKKTILGFITIGVLIFSACAQQKKTTKGTVFANSGKKALGIEQIVMERTACFGTCPAYRIIINKDGQTKYISRYYTEYEGTFEKQLDQEKTAELFNEFAKYHVDTCQEEYKSLVQDLPGIIYEFTYKNGKEQVIRQAEFGPEFLKELARKVDALVVVDDSWKKIAEPEKHK